MAQSEARLRARVRMFLKDCLPAPVYFTAIEHGVKLVGTKEQRERAWGRLKAQGVKTGLADIFVWSPGRFLALELKSGKNTTSDAQDAFRDALHALVHSYAVCWTVEDVGLALIRHDIALPANWHFQSMHHDAALATDRHKAVRKPSKPRQPKPTRRQVAAGNRLSLVGVRG